VPLTAGWLAYHNLRGKRDDRQGATRLAAFVFLVQITGLLLSATYVPTYAQVDRVATLTSYAGFTAALVWLGYVALEPLIRRQWPQVMISWTRALAGHIRDPRIGRDLLVGVLFGILDALLQLFAFAVQGRFRGTFWLDHLGNVRHTVGYFLTALPASMGIALALFLLLFILRILLRRPWAAGCGYICVMAALSLLAGGSILSILSAIVEQTLTVLLLLRFWVLSLVAAIFVSTLVQQAPLTADLRAWHASGSLLLIIAILGSSIWASRLAVARRPWMPDELL
jgi:hypothetical protein